MVRDVLTFRIFDRDRMMAERVFHICDILFRFFVV